jgi:hypothetical protein
MDAAMPRPDPMPPILDAARALAEAGQPRPLYEALDRASARAIGHKLFTLLVVDEAKREVERVYTSNPKSYPVGGRKPLQMTGWGEQVIVGRRPYVGRSAADIEWAFFDHKLIQSLGLASVLNVPVVHDGRCLGTMNLLHEANWYAEADAEVGMMFAALLIPAFAAEQGRLG